MTKTPFKLTLGLLLLTLVGCGSQLTGSEPEGVLLSQLSSGPVVNDPGDSGDGTCGTTCTLRDAIAFAEPGSTITFAVTGTIELEAEELVIAKDLVIAGPGASSLSVSGGYVDDENRGRGIRVLRIEDGATVAISGLTITGGAPSPAVGGGVLNKGTLSLTESVVSGNLAMYGGGIFNDKGTLTLMNTTVSDNRPTLEDPAGGGILDVEGRVTLIGSTVSGNEPEGITSYSGTLVVTSSTISGNAGRNSGGVYLVWATATITDSTISDNTAWWGTGGGITNNNSALVVERSTISGNRGIWGGGVYSATDPDDAARHTTILNSTVSGNGSGVNLEDLDPEESSEFLGGGIYNALGLMRIVLSTVTGNDGAGVYSGAGRYPDVITANTEVEGSLIWGNTSATGTPADVAAFNTTDNHYVSLAHNLIGAAGDFTGAFDRADDQTGVGNAMLGPLTSNGGPTRTHALLAGSPAIDAGTCADRVGDTVATDQRGVGRPQGSACDTGAFELEQTAPSFTSSCTYLINPRTSQRNVTVTWAHADPGVTRIEVADGKFSTKQMAPTQEGSWTISVKTDPTYGVWGGTDRKDASQVWVPAGTACTP